jgi:long-chain acyl-CoA synthetase
VWDKIVFKKVRDDVFGGCLRFMLTGASPISPDVCDFFKVVCCCPVIEGYGQSESCGASFTTILGDPFSGYVGGPTIMNEIRLMDVPDMKYTSEDKEEDGTPCPRGEVCFRGPNIMHGYYKNEEATKEAIINGWLHSGDIGKILPNGALKLVDRKKNIFKLA